MLRLCDKGCRRAGGKELDFFLVSSTFWQNLTLAEEFEHGVLTDSAFLPGIDDGVEFVAGETFGAEIGVEANESLVIGNRGEGVGGGQPPIGPAEDLGERITEAGGDAAEDAVLAALAEFDGLGGLADFLLVFEQAGTEDGHLPFGTVHGAFKGGEAVAVELEETGSSAGLLVTQAVLEPIL